MSEAERNAKAIQKVTLTGAVLDLFLGIAKIVVGWLSQSHALIADGIHSLSDLLTDALVLIVAHYGAQAPDKSHPYGHARFETLATLLLGSTLIAVAGAIAWDSLERLISSTPAPIPEWPALIVAILSIMGKEWIFHYTMRVARKVQSELLKANAWHSRSDALSSIVVLIGLLGSMAGWHWLDQIAAVIVGVMVGYIGWKLMTDSIRELIDTALPEQQLAEIRSELLRTEGVIDVHDIRSRTMGARILLDLHLQVSPRVSVSEGHYIGVRAEYILKSALNISDVVVHIDTHDDSSSEDILPGLPGRAEILHQIEDCWQKTPINYQTDRVQIHYLNDSVHLDIMIAGIPPDEDTVRQMTQCIQSQPWAGQVRLWFTPL
ncbi:cation diffusion facilitator family transporter [Oceanospirillum sediminis]|uniref:Cation transporter n=1 Tax=Oceanospirillum sediminis TaxID=2760088 RepID=A0A839IKP7_9GAMM|nr:cation diffusion facilitator family transporter [Oceanospirillum sediminis]MBB1485461.1 cation transporter [Oceanospirillum sediminis]